MLKIYFDQSFNLNSLSQLVETTIRNDYDKTVISYSISKQFEKLAERADGVFIQILLGIFSKS